MTTPSTRVVLPLAALALAVALTALLLGVLAAPSTAIAQVDPANAEALGRVSGLVTDRQGRPAEGIQVDFYSELHPNPSLPWYVDSLRTVKTDAAGRYATLLPPRIYRVRFSDPNGVYGLQYYSGALTVPAAADVVVAGNASDGISAQLSLGGSITGSITNVAAGIDPYGPYSVVAYRQAGAAWEVVQEVNPSPANTYVLRGLAPGVYHICLAPLAVSRDGPLPCYERAGGGPPYAKDVPLAAGEVVANIDIAATGFQNLATVRGKVTDEGGSPLAGIDVRAYGDWPSYPVTTTDAAGAYELQVPAPSSVRMAFDNPGGLYIQQWYTRTEEADSATELMLQPSEVREGIDGALRLGGRITGTITLSGVTPGGSLSVLARYAENPQWDYRGYSGLYDPRTGRYTIGGLPPGGYRVCEYPQASPVWPSLRCFEERADGGPPTVTVTAGATEGGIDFLLIAPPAPEGYVLTGTVTAEDGQPLGDMEVQLFSFPETIFGYASPRLAATTTASDGSYRFDGLGAGRFQLRAVDPTELYASTFYTNSIDGSSDINLGNSPQQARDIRMARGGALSGQVRRDDGQPLPYARLRLLPLTFPYPQYEWPDTYYTNADGRFRIRGLPPGAYGVCAVGTAPPRYSQRCFGSLPDDGPVWNLDPVFVAAGAETGNVNITLGPIPPRRLYLPLLRGGAGATALAPASPLMMGRIAGSIRNANGEPLEGIYVDIYQSLAPNGWTEPIYGMQTDAAGRYRFEPLAAGVYRVAFHDPAGVYAQQYYSNALTFDTAAMLELNGSFLDGIDGRLEKAGSITGTVLGDGLPSTPIGVFAQVDGAWRLVVTADYDTQQHTYTAGGLPPGTYRICWYSGTEPGLATGPCYDHVGGGVNYAAGVSVTAGAVTGGIDLTTSGLVDGGTIHGIVRGVGGAPLAGIAVHLSTPSGELYSPSGHAWTEVQEAHTDAGGVYQFDDLLPNDYLLEYRDPNGWYYAQYYGNTQDIAHARVITLQRDEQRDDVDITLTQGGMIEGTVLLDGSLPPAEALIAAYNTSVNALNPYTATYDMHSGAYRIGGLPPGGYQVMAEASYLANFWQPVVAFYGGATDLYHAKIITVTAGSRLNNIDINLAQNGFDGVITGTVTGQGGVPLPGMRAELYLAQADWLAAPRLLYTTTDLGGGYRFDGLLDGVYYVRVVDPSGVYSPGYSGSQALYTWAVPVVIRDGAGRGPVDVQLLGSSSLRGHVYDGSGGAVSGARVYISAVYIFGSTVLTMTLTDGTGSYASGPLPPGRYSVCAALSRNNGNDHGCYGARLNDPFAAGEFGLAPGTALDGIDIYFGGMPGMVDQVYIPVVAHSPSRP